MVPLRNTRKTDFRISTWNFAQRQDLMGIVYCESFRSFRCPYPEIRTSSLLMYMGELRPYCTVAFRTRKRLYLAFYLMNFDNFFFQILLIVHPTYRKNIKLLADVATEFSNQKGKPAVLFCSINRRKLRFCPQFWLDENDFLELFCS